MVIGVKERKDKEVKFSDKIRRNFERFKDKVEEVGKKAIILGGVGIGIGLGCASDGNGKIYYDPSEELGQFMYNEAMYRRSEIYKGCITFEDSLKATERAWANADLLFDTYPNAPVMIPITILSIATYPYKDTLDNRQNQNKK